MIYVNQIIMLYTLNLHSVNYISIKLEEKKTLGWQDQMRLYMQKHIIINNTIWKLAFLKSASEIPLFLYCEFRIPLWHPCHEIGNFKCQIAC